MHQLGLVRALRAAMIFVAAIIVAAQVLSFIRASESRAAEVPAMLPAHLGAVGFDGASPLMAGVAAEEEAVLH